MHTRQQHESQVRQFLQEHLSSQDWRFSLPHGSGMETYFAEGNQGAYFVKVGAPVERYLTIAELGLTPRVIAHGRLEDGSSVIVQPRIQGRTPSQKDYWENLERVAGIVRSLHNEASIQSILPPASSNLHRDVGLQALDALHQKWEHYKTRVPDVAEFVETALAQLASKINMFSTEGLVASHSDICNANWLIAFDGKIYLIDLDSMSLDDPAQDLAVFLWWYYPRDMRERFLQIAGYRYDEEFQFRMQVRRSMHCLNITLPREQSFDRFDPAHYGERLEDFRASLEGRENPKGYRGS